MWEMFWRWFSTVCACVCKRQSVSEKRLYGMFSNRTRITTQAGSSSCMDVGVSSQRSLSVKHVRHYHCFISMSMNTDSGLRDKFVQIKQLMTLEC